MDPGRPTAESGAGNLSPFLPTWPAKAAPITVHQTFPDPSAVWAKEARMGTASSKNTGGCPKGGHDEQRQQLATAGYGCQAKAGPAPIGLCWA